MKTNNACTMKRYLLVLEYTKLSFVIWLLLDGFTIVVKLGLSIFDDTRWRFVLKKDQLLTGFHDLLFTLIQLCKDRLLLYAILKVILLLTSPRWWVILPAICVFLF